MAQKALQILISPHLVLQSQFMWIIETLYREIFTGRFSLWWIPLTQKLFSKFADLSSYEKLSKFKVRQKI